MSPRRKVGLAILSCLVIPSCSDVIVETETSLSWISRRRFCRVFQMIAEGEDPAKVEGVAGYYCHIEKNTCNILGGVVKLYSGDRDAAIKFFKLAKQQKILFPYHCYADGRVEPRPDKD